MDKTTLPTEVLNHNPNVADDAFIAHTAVVIGDVTLKSGASIWYQAVLRGDINGIEVGERSNIQDGCVLHVENDRKCIVGNDVTVGHKAILHGCTVEDGCLIGMGAIILNGAIIKKGAVIAAGAVVKENTIVESNTLWAGVPAKEGKKLPESVYDQNVNWAEKYVGLAGVHREKINL